MTQIHRKITLTKAAANKLKKLEEEINIAATGIKFADRKGFCGEGFDYLIDFALTPEENDEIFYSRGIAIYVPKLSLPRLQGSIIDYSKTNEENSIDFEKLTFRGYFNVLNPNVKEHCPCGCGNGFQC